MPDTKLEKNGSFVIHDYNASRPWASFFPGIAGLFGIPLWVFYVNRGQCIVSCGIRTKDEAIMEFLPANKAYQLVSTQGFRTFIKIKEKGKNIFYEPFASGETLKDPRIKNRMVITPYELNLVEENTRLGLRVGVSYFSIPHEPFAAMAREVTIENTSRGPKTIELMDGLCVLVPYGINNFFLKEMSRTIEAWMTVENISSGLPLYKLTTDPRDTAQVSFVKGAHFYTSFRNGAGQSSSKIIADPAFIFGPVTDFTYPLRFCEAKSFVYPKTQIAKNKTPCAFTFLQNRLPKGGSMKLYSLIGHVFDAADTKKLGIDRLDEPFMTAKKKENRALIESIMDRVFTASGSSAFDLYARQTYLDNVMRGGLPFSFSLDGRKKSIYVFSRKHGDLERDYNRFQVCATYFSEGEGNYRDINQNRRMDVFFNPLLGEKNVEDFMNLLQLDGYNPLVFKGEKFTLDPAVFAKSPLAKFFRPNDIKKVSHILSRPFVLGEILRCFEENKISLSCTLEEFVRVLLNTARSAAEAVFGEGYWSDHWAYNTDLLESFYALYPDRFRELLLEKSDFTYYDTHVFVKSRPERYCVSHGEVRQYHSLGTDDEKNALIQKRAGDKNKVRCAFGEGAVLKTTLIDKIVCLIVNKTATLDPYGTGIEMEADKPDWYDALNGLPGLLGSSISQTFELKRLIVFLKKVLSEWHSAENHPVALLREVHDFLGEIKALLESDLTPFDFWDKSNSAKESYRSKTKRGVSGDFKKISLSELKAFFDLICEKLDAGIAASRDPKSGSYCTYFYYKVTKHDSLVNKSNKHVIVPSEFQQKRLPLFLEGFVHALRTEHAKAKGIHRAVRKSPLWDKKLKMYKVNASLEQESFELGRAKAFTPGWLENESIWLHMEYKYLLELLKNRLYDEFYDDFFHALVPFQEPRRYGRSILENSSFIVSSSHPDPGLHGAGFVARLSGSTAEFIHMWLLMNIGDAPFFLDDSGKLCLRFRPALSAKLFTKSSFKKGFYENLKEDKEISVGPGTYTFLFLNATFVTYVNPKKKDTFGPRGVRPKRLSLFDANGPVAEIEGEVLKFPYAGQVREGKISRIEVLLG